MEDLQGALAAMPEKYVADFVVLVQDPLLQQQLGPRRRTMITTHILRAKKGIPFSAISYFFLRQRAQFSKIGSDL
jgi:hypothetical protein